MALTVGTITGWLDAAYPQRLAESWDRVGLQVGDPDAEVTRVLFAVDPQMSWSTRPVNSEHS